MTNTSKIKFWLICTVLNGFQLLAADDSTNPPVVQQFTLSEQTPEAVILSSIIRGHTTRASILADIKSEEEQQIFYVILAEDPFFSDRRNDETIDIKPRQKLEALESASENLDEHLQRLLDLGFIKSQI